MRRSTAVLLLTVLPLLPACDGILGVRNCTLIGCRDGLILTIVDPPAGPVMLEVMMPGGATRTFDCDQACPPFFQIPDVRPDEVTLRLTTSAGVRTDVQQPVWVRHQPNGRGCGPVCWQAELTIAAQPPAPSY